MYSHFVYTITLTTYIAKLVKSKLQHPRVFWSLSFDQIPSGATRKNQMAIGILLTCPCLGYIYSYIYIYNDYPQDPTMDIAWVVGLA